jgi:arylsulfatase A-like enzyme
MPTLLSLAGVQVPSSSDGLSFSDVLKGASDSHRSFAVSTGYLGSPTAAVTVVEDRWAEVLTPRESGRLPVADKAVDDLAKGAASREVTSDMLFDLEADPGQEHDVSSSHRAEVGELRGCLVRELERVQAAERVIGRWR